MDGGGDIPAGTGSRNPRTIIVGAGAAGMALAVKLRQAGLTIRLAHARGIATLDAKPEAMRKFIADDQARLSGTIWVTGCTSWYMDDKGVPETWTGTPDEYRALLRVPRLEEFDIGCDDDASRVGTPA